MSILNLAIAASEADALFSKFQVKPDGTTEATFIHTADFVFPIANSAEAEILGQLIPGAKDMYLRASQEDTNWKTSVTVTPEIQNAYFELADAKTGRVMFKGGGEIKTAQLRASKRETRLTIRVAFGGQVAETSMNFTKLLRSNVHVVYSASQQALPFKKGEVRPVPETGDVVAASNEDGVSVYGRVVEVDDDAGTVIINDFGAEHVVELAKVKSFWKPAEADLEARTRSFKGRCTKRQLVASWSALTVAVGEAFAGGAPGEGPHLITPSIVERAVEVLVREKGGGSTSGTGSDAGGEDGAGAAPTGGARTSGAPIMSGGPTGLA